MSMELPPPKKKLPIAKLAIGGLVLAVMGAVVLYLVGWETAWTETKRIFNAALELIAAAGPVVFYLAMAILPTFAVPMGPFAVMSGLVVREQLGLPLVIALGLLAMAVNVTIAYWLARRWLRPPLTRLVTRWGYRLPEVESGDATNLILLLRLTPGPPFFVQNYLLGLAEVPFGRYLILSCATQGLLLSGLVVFGDALSQGKGKMVMLAVGGLAAVMIGTHFVRKHLAKKKNAATP